MSRLNATNYLLHFFDFPTMHLLFLSHATALCKVRAHKWRPKIPPALEQLTRLTKSRSCWIHWTSLTKTTVCNIDEKQAPASIKWTEWFIFTAHQQSVHHKQYSLALRSTSNSLSRPKANKRSKFSLQPWSSPSHSLPFLPWSLPPAPSRPPDAWRTVTSKVAPTPSVAWTVEIWLGVIRFFLFNISQWSPTSYL